MIFMIFIMQTILSVIKKTLPIEPIFIFASTNTTVRAPNILLLVVMRSFVSDSGVFLKQLPNCAIKRLKI